MQKITNYSTRFLKYRYNGVFFQNAVYYHSKNNHNSPYWRTDLIGIGYNY
jgi:hypothetical protein